MNRNKRAAFSVRQRGFTMSEMLAVMAIIMILSGIAVPSGMRVVNNIKQMALNRAAETIYMTAQRNLIAYKVRGNPTPPEGGIVTSGDARTAHEDPSDDTSPLIFNPYAPVNIVLPANTISPALCDKNWTIKYNSNFLVTAVYYSEDKEIVLETEFATGKIGKVGYYG